MTGWAGVALAASGAITLWAAVPYIRDTALRRTRPRLSSWGLWAVAMGTGGMAGITSGQVSGWFVLLCAAECAAVAVLGWVRGSREFGWLDGACTAVALAAVVLLAGPRDPGQAAALSVAADLAAYTPTIRHAWRAPAEETWTTFAWFGLASAVVLAVSPLGFLSSAYTAYLAVFDTSVAVLILARRRVVAADVLVRPVAGPLPPDDGLCWYERPEWYAALRMSARLPPVELEAPAAWLCTAHRLGCCRECARYPRPWLRSPAAGGP